MVQQTMHPINRTPQIDPRGWIKIRTVATTCKAITDLLATDTIPPATVAGATLDVALIQTVRGWGYMAN